MKEEQLKGLKLTISVFGDASQALRDNFASRENNPDINTITKYQEPITAHLILNLEPEEIDTSPSKAGIIFNRTDFKKIDLERGCLYSEENICRLCLPGYNKVEDYCICDPEFSIEEIQAISLFIPGDGEDSKIVLS